MTTFNIKFFSRTMVALASLSAVVFPILSATCIRKPCSHLFYGLSEWTFTELLWLSGAFGWPVILGILPFCVLIIRPLSRSASILLIITSLVVIFCHWLAWSPFYAQGSKIILVEAQSILGWYLVGAAQLVFSLITFFMVHFLNRK